MLRSCSGGCSHPERLQQLGLPPGRGDVRATELPDRWQAAHPHIVEGRSHPTANRCARSQPLRRPPACRSRCRGCRGPRLYASECPAQLRGQGDPLPEPTRCLPASHLRHTRIVSPKPHPPGPQSALQTGEAAETSCEGKCMNGTPWPLHGPKSRCHRSKGALCCPLPRLCPQPATPRCASGQTESPG